MSEGRAGRKEDLVAVSPRGGNPRTRQRCEPERPAACVAVLPLLGKHAGSKIERSAQLVTVSEQGPERSHIGAAGKCRVGTVRTYTAANQQTRARGEVVVDGRPRRPEPPVSKAQHGLVCPLALPINTCDRHGPGRVWVDHGEAPLRPLQLVLEELAECRRPAARSERRRAARLPAPVRRTRRSRPMPRNDHERVAALEVAKWRKFVTDHEHEARADPALRQGPERPLRQNRPCPSVRSRRASRPT